MKTQLQGDFDAVVLSGGGVKGIAMLGSLAYLHDTDALKNVKYYVGTSAGALLATVMALGMQPKDIFKRHVLTFKYTPDIDITRLERNFGLDSGKSLQKWIDGIVPKDMTFETMYEKTGKTLVICATNLNMHSAEYFSKDSTPDLLLRDALRMSCSVPLYFSAIRYNKSLYVDGGVSCNFPVQHAKDLGAKRILGIRFATPPKEGDHAWNLESFMGALLESNINTKYQPGSSVVLRLDTKGIALSLNFKLSAREKHALYDSGYTQTQVFFKKHQ